MSGIGPAGLPGSAGPGDAAAAAGVTGISVSNPDLPGPGATSPGGTQIGRPAGRLRHAEHVMGTVFSFDVPASAAPVLPEVLSWLHWVDDTFSTYSCGSDVSRFGRGELTLAECAPELAEVIAECAAIEERTDGYFTAWPGGRFDPSGLVKGWSIERASNMLSAAAETKARGSLGRSRAPRRDPLRCSPTHRPLTRAFGPGSLGRSFVMGSGFSRIH